MSANSQPSLDQSTTTPCVDLGTTNIDKKQQEEATKKAAISVEKTAQETSDHVTTNETKQDDWTPPIDHCEYNLHVPSFIRLFCIRRILHQYHS